MRPVYLTLLAACFALTNLCAEDLKVAEEHRSAGIVALQESQKTPRLVVVAARHFAKAAAIFEKLGDSDGVVEMNSFLYWCKKKMTRDDIEAFTKGGEAVVTEKLKAVEAQKIEKSDAKTWFDRAEAFAKAKPGEHLLIAIRFFEVADRFKGTDVSLEAQDRSLKEMQLVASAAPKTEPAPSSSKPDNAEPAAKVAVPDAVKLKDAEKTIKDIFKDEFAKRSADDKKALGQKLLQQAGEIRDDPATRYVLLKEAAAAAVAAADAETALNALDALGQSYELDALALKAESLAKIVPATADAAKALARVYVKVIDDAVAADNYDAAMKLAAAADTVARKAQDMPLVTQLQARGKEVRALQTDFAKVKAAQATLKDKPDDPEANLAMGKFLCFTKGDWKKGLPLLANCSDLSLKELSGKDLQAGADTDSLIACADLWWTYAEKQNSFAKTAIFYHAEDYYLKALPQSNGLIRIRIIKRLESLPQPRTFMVLWNAYNNIYNNFGTTEVNIILYANQAKLWRQDHIEIEWVASRDCSTLILLPRIGYDRVCIEIIKSHMNGPGLSEIQIMRAGTNIALGCHVTAGSSHGVNIPSRLTDGIITSKEYEKGYWLAIKKEGVFLDIDVDLTKKQQLPAKK